MLHLRLPPLVQQQHPTQTDAAKHAMIAARSNRKSDIEVAMAGCSADACFASRCCCAASTAAEAAAAEAAATAAALIFFELSIFPLFFRIHSRSGRTNGCTMKKRCLTPELERYTWFASSTVEGRCCTKCHMMAPISPLVVGAHAVVSGSMPGTIKSVCGFPSAVTWILCAGLMRCSTTMPVSSCTSRAAQSSPSSPALTLPRGKPQPLAVLRPRTSKTRSIAASIKMAPYTGIRRLNFRNRSMWSSKFARCGCSSGELLNMSLAKSCHLA
mmetsp:Transcript_17307/g.52044  ORF Transcript_17307/g.52044 Transcript_17307/m.52044 type:complete len:271 (+) Transcript_17307:996-1808(+)